MSSLQKIEIGWSNEIINTLKSTVAQGLTDPEFLLFRRFCESTGLNPFRKEIWAIKSGGRLQIMIGINGYLRIANDHPAFDGMEVEVDDDEKPTKAICKVYRKDRKHPAVGVALLKEYGKETPTWKQMPRTMLCKVAKSIALREAFVTELGGTYTADEMPQEYEPPSTDAPFIEQTEYVYKLEKLPEDKQAPARLIALASGARERSGYFVTNQPIKKLERALLTPEEFSDWSEHVAQE